MRYKNDVKIYILEIVENYRKEKYKIFFIDKLTYRYLYVYEFTGFLCIRLGLSRQLTSSKISITDDRSQTLPFSRHCKRKHVC